MKGSIGNLEDDEKTSTTTTFPWNLYSVSNGDKIVYNIGLESTSIDKENNMNKMMERISTILKIKKC